MPGILEAGKSVVLGMADLPDEILRLIMGRLCFEDQNRFRSVCRSWRTVGGVKSQFQLPWILVFSEYGSGSYFAEKSYFLYNSSTKKSYCFDVPFPNTCSSHPPPFGKRIIGPKILATNSGWLLVSHLFDCYCFEAPFFFNPFTRRTVRLPAHNTLPLARNWDRMKYAFHLCPVEQCFTVYTVWVVPGLVVVNSWRTGEQEWETHEIAGVHDNRERADFTMVCDGKGALYCWFVEKKLVAFFRRAGHDGFDYVEFPLPEMRIALDWGKIRLCVSEGDLYAVSMGSLRSRALRLDLAGRAWVAEENDEKAYILGKIVMSAVVVSQPVKEFAGHVVGDGFKIERRAQNCTFRQGCYTRKPGKVYSWYFLCPQEILSYYNARQLARLHTISIEPPTF